MTLYPAHKRHGSVPLPWQSLHTCIKLRSRDSPLLPSSLLSSDMVSTCSLRSQPGLHLRRAGEQTWHEIASHRIASHRIALPPAVLEAPRVHPYHSLRLACRCHFEKLGILASSRGCCSDVVPRLDMKVVPTQDLVHSRPTRANDGLKRNLEQSQHEEVG